MGRVSCLVSSTSKSGTSSPCLSHFTGALYSFSFTSRVSQPFSPSFFIYDYPVKERENRNCFNDCRELSFLRALSLETWWRLQWQKLFSPRALGSPTFSCSFGERKHHVTLLPPKLGILETVLELIGGTGSFVHPMSQQRHSFNTWENEEWKSFPLCVSQKELREDGKSPWQHRGDFLNGGVSYTRTRKSCYWQREVWGGFHNLL